MDKDQQEQVEDGGFFWSYVIAAGIFVLILCLANAIWVKYNVCCCTREMLPGKQRSPRNGKPRRRYKNSGSLAHEDGGSSWDESDQYSLSTYK